MRIKNNKIRMRKNEIYFESETYMNFLNKLPDESVDLIIIDPPYLTTNEKWDKKEVVNKRFSKELFRIAKDSCSLYVWCGIGEKSQSLIRWFPIFNKRWYFKDLITWKKQRGIGMKRGWLYTREEILWFVKNNKKFVWYKEEQYGNEERAFEKVYKDKKRMEKYLKSVKSKFKRLTNVWVDILEPNISWGKREVQTLHFTPKPIKALKRIIKVHTKENDLVLDCFFGSGTIIEACKNLNRRFVGCDINEDYVKSVRIREKE